MFVDCPYCGFLVAVDDTGRPLPRCPNCAQRLSEPESDAEAAAPLAPSMQGSAALPADPAATIADQPATEPAEPEPRYHDDYGIDDEEHIGDLVAAGEASQRGTGTLDPDVVGETMQRETPAEAEVAPLHDAPQSMLPGAVESQPEPEVEAAPATEPASEPQAMPQAESELGEPEPEPEPVREPEPVPEAAPDPVPGSVPDPEVGLAMEGGAAREAELEPASSDIELATPLQPETDCEPEPTAESEPQLPSGPAIPEAPAPVVARRRRRAVAATPSFARAADAARTPPDRRRLALRCGVVAGLSLLLALQLSLADRARLSTDARWRPFLVSLCSVLRCALPTWHEPRAFVIVERDVRAHPSLSGVLRVSARFRNGARWPQAWPVLQLTFSDVHGRSVATRLFQPREYLGGAPTQSTLGIGQVASISMDVIEPGAQAVAFTFDFK